jgi:hypothetical protein
VGVFKATLSAGQCNRADHHAGHDDIRHFLCSSSLIPYAVCGNTEQTLGKTISHSDKCLSSLVSWVCAVVDALIVAKPQYTAPTGGSALDLVTFRIR